MPNPNPLKKYFCCVFNQSNKCNTPELMLKVCPNRAKGKFLAFVLLCCEQGQTAADRRGVANLRGCDGRQGGHECAKHAGKRCSAQFTILSKVSPWKTDEKKKKPFWLDL